MATTSAFDFGVVRPASVVTNGLNGGSKTAGNGKIGVSFDNWAICDSTDECTPKLFLAPFDPEGKLSITLGSVKSSY